MREFMDVLAPALSSASRPKSHYRGRRLEAPQRAGRSRSAGAERDAVAAEPAGPRGDARRAVRDGAATGTGWSLRRLRAGAAGGQPRGPPPAAADVHHRPGRGSRLAAALWGKLAAAARLGTGLRLRGALRSVHRRSATGRLMSGPSARHSARTVRGARSRRGHRPTSVPSNHDRQPRSPSSPIRSGTRAGSTHQFSNFRTEGRTVRAQ